MPYLFTYYHARPWAQLGWRNICGLSEPILRLKWWYNSFYTERKKQADAEEKLPVNLLAYNLMFFRRGLDLDLTNRINLRHVEETVPNFCRFFAKKDQLADTIEVVWVKHLRQSRLIYGTKGLVLL